MTNSEFITFFDQVLLNQIPAKNRSRIANYWKRFGQERNLYLTDDEIRVFESLFGSVQYAAVGAFNCYNHFAFRLDFFREAQKDLLKTLIQHELIHADLRSDDTIESHLQKRLLSESNTISDPITNAMHKAQGHRLELFEENRVENINTVWGGKEDSLRIWIKNKECNLQQEQSN